MSENNITTSLLACTHNMHTHLTRTLASSLVPNRTPTSTIPTAAKTTPTTARLTTEGLNVVQIKKHNSNLNLTHVIHNDAHTYSYNDARSKCSFICLFVCLLYLMCHRCIYAPFTVPMSPVCPKCGFVKKSDRPSCCARGGAWFNKCGDEGDSKFAHTWTEGIQACEGLLAGHLIGTYES